VQFSQMQGEAIKKARAWLDDPKGSQIFRIFGYAGSGKSTIAKEIAAHVNGTVLYACYTGKAALVMRKKGCHGASTIHSLIYRATLTNGKISFEINRDSELRGAKLLIVDECSMVGKELGEDVLSFGTRVLVLGDPGQLPPIKGAGFFDSAKPDVMLTEIHRQAADNPIIALATAARLGKNLKLGAYGESRVLDETEWDDAEALTCNQLIVGTNATRKYRINIARDVYGHQGPYPRKGERLICLRNDHKVGLLNGSQWLAEGDSSTSGSFVTMNVVDTDDPERVIPVRVWPEFFDGDPSKIDEYALRGTQQFDYAYAITCHKSQGSEWDHVVVIDQSKVFRQDASRWLYCAITRASEKVTIVV